MSGEHSTHDSTSTSDTGHSTSGVRTLLGDPKKAILKLSIPMVVAMSAHTIYNLTDAVWVSGLGPESLAAVGFVFPFLFLAMAVASGVGIGGGAAVSRKIGARDKDGADSIATHTIVLVAGFVVVFTAIMLVFSEPMLRRIGAGTALEPAVKYARILFSGIMFVFFQHAAIAILRSEGDVKRAMYAMVGGAVLNMLLDPLFIYVLGFGVAGAAWATVLSMFLVSIVTFYWLFVERKTYVSFRFRGFRFDSGHVWDISRVGFPASVSQMSMAIMAFAVTAIVASVGGPDGVAVYTTAWRIIALAALPVLGVASAVTAVAGAAFGAREYGKVEIAFSYALKTCVAVEGVFALLMVLFAAQITWVFTWSSDSERIVNDLVVCLRILWVLLPGTAFGMLSAAMFQGVGKGLYALMMTLLRTLVFTVPLAWLFGIQLDWGLRGVWIGMAVAGLSYAPIAYGWAILHMRRLERTCDNAGLQASSVGS